MYRRLAYGSLIGILAVSCNGDIDKPDGGTNPPPGDALIETTDNGDGTFTTTANASSKEIWVYMDLETGEEVDVSNPSTSDDWDIAFQRFRIILNGGVNGNGGVEVAVLEGAGFGAVTDAPGDGYTTDEDDGEDEGEIPDDAIRIGPTSETGPWAYDIETHELSGSGAVFVVKSVEGNFFKLEFLEYYNDVGDAGYVEMHWAQLGSQLGPGEMLVSWDRGYTYLSIENGVVSIDDPETSLDWDLGVRFVGWQTNGGEERAGSAGALDAGDVGFDAVTEAPTVGYAQDATIPYPGPPGSPDFSGNPVATEWFAYDQSTHEATPLDKTILVRGARGNYGKLRILTYDEPNKTYKLKLAPVTRRVDTLTTNVDATADWVYISVRAGEVAEVTDASTETHWDLAFNRTLIRTNSGTSGAGEGGAHAPSAGALDGVTAAPTADYSADEMVVDPVDGMTMVSANAELSNWWTFDGTSSSTVPVDQSYVVKAADGSYAKLKITGYTNDGEYTIDWAYAGPEQTEF